MGRKRIVRWVAGVLMLLLIALTGISNRVYRSMLPKVRTRSYEATVGELLDGYGLWELVAWVPVECAFPSERENVVYFYRMCQRPGLWSQREYYVERIEVRIIDRREDAVLVDEGFLSYAETLVCETDLPLKDGEVVCWLNGGS